MGIIKKENYECPKGAQNIFIKKFHQVYLQLFSAFLNLYENIYREWLIF